MNDDRTAIRGLLEQWAHRTSTGQQNRILDNHKPEALIFDVLEPLQYEGVTAYRESWDEWQPETAGEIIFTLERLKITAGDQAGFAHGLIRCGGTTLEEKRFEDLVRATFCLEKTDGRWRIAHQHISKPMPR